ncbi:MAG TPA: hypothetical protein VL334_02135 [Anaerolineae bacterium]|nr:hypothetical protein [Anaerolineae bacterium]
MSVQHPLPAAAAASDQAEHETFVSLRLSLAGSPWRLSGGWLLLAGFVAAAGRDTWRGPWLPVLLALALAELVWGALWWQLAPAHAWSLHRARRRPALPYVQPASPAGRLLGWPEPGAAAAMVRAGLPLAALAILLALPIGQAALLLTGLVLLTVLLGMAAGQAGLTGLAGWLQALIQAALPFALGVALAGQWPPPQGAYLVGLGLGYTLLARSMVPPSRQSPSSRMADLLIAAGGFASILVVLLATWQPLAAGVVGLLAVAPLLLLARMDDQQQRTAQPWLLAAVMFSSAAVGFGIG